MRSPTFTLTICADACGARAPAPDLVRPGRDVSFPRGGAEIDAVDDDAERLASGRVHDQVPERRLPDQRWRVHHGLPVRRDVRVRGERQVPRPGHAHRVGSDGKPQERGDW